MYINEYKFKQVFKLFVGYTYKDKPIIDKNKNAVRRLFKADIIKEKKNSKGEWIFTFEDLLICRFYCCLRQLRFSHNKIIKKMLDIIQAEEALFGTREGYIFSGVTIISLGPKKFVFCLRGPAGYVFFSENLHQVVFDFGLDELKEKVNLLKLSQQKNNVEENFVSGGLRT